MDYTYFLVSQVVDIKAKTAEYYDPLYKDQPSYWRHIKYAQYNTNIIL